MSTYKDLLFLQGYMGAASVEAERVTEALDARAPAANEHPLEAAAGPRPLTLVQPSREVLQVGGCC